MPNGLDFIHTMIGTAMVGALFVPINARLAPREIAHIVPDSAMKVLFTTDAVDQHVDYVTRLRHAFPDLATAPEGAALSLADAPELGTAVILGTRTARGFITGQEFLSRGAGIDPDAVRAAATAVTPDMPYIMMYTSGTTAEPKGCALTHESVVRLGQAVGEQAFHITEADRMWNALPMFHVSAQAPMVGVLNAAATYISMTHFEPGARADRARTGDPAVPHVPDTHWPLAEPPRLRPGHLSPGARDAHGRATRPAAQLPGQAAAHQPRQLLRLHRDGRHPGDGTTRRPARAPPHLR
jgi:fatty-acyl-CoA synthase